MMEAREPTIRGDDGCFSFNPAAEHKEMIKPAVQTNYSVLNSSRQSVSAAPVRMAAAQSC